MTAVAHRHTPTHQVADLGTTLAAGEQPAPSSAEGPEIQRVLDAVGRSAGNRSIWTEIPA